jgi:hypothetical protein
LVVESISGKAKSVFFIELFLYNARTIGNNAPKEIAIAKKTGNRLIVPASQ